MPHEQLAVVQEHVGLDGIDLLGVRLPEGGTAAIIVVRMDQDGALGHSRGAGAQCCEQQPDFEYLFHCGMLFFEFDDGHHGGMVGDITATERIGSTS